MDMQLIRENVRLEQPLGTGRSTAVVEGEVTLPGGLREEARVLCAEAMAVAEGAEALQDRVNVTGRVIFHVLYTQGDPSKVNAIEAAADFTHLCSLPGSQPRAAVTPRMQVGRVEAKVSGGRMSMRAEVEVGAAAMSQTPVEAGMEVDGSDWVEVKLCQKTIRRSAARGDADALLREEFSLPADLAIRETLYATACPVLAEVSGGMGRIGLTGYVALEAVHASDLPGRPLVVTKHRIPLQHSVEIAGEEGELLEGRATVRDVAVVSQDDGDGERTLRTEVLLALEGWSDLTETISLIEDAYTTQGDDLRLTGREIRCRTGSTRVHAAESGKTTLLLPDSAPPVRQMLLARITPVLRETERNGERTTVSGQLDVTLIYMTDGSPAPVSIRRLEPFRMTFPVRIEEDALLQLTATEAEALPLTSDRVELRYIMHLEADGMPWEPVHLVTDAQMIAAPEPTTDVVLYFTQPGETVWDIARRYRVAESGVRALNPELPDELKAGQSVVVWRRPVACE